MIDFRYHIVSIAAVFLALGIGIATGATVLDRAVVDALRNQLNTLRDQLDDHRRQVSDLEGDQDLANELVAGLADRATDGVLAGNRILFIRTSEELEWQTSIRRSVTEAGAQDAGSLVLTDRWELRDAEDHTRLQHAFADLTLDDEDPGSHAARLLGSLLVDDAERGLVANLADAGFLQTIPADDESQFPPADVQVVIFAAEERAWLADLGRGAGSVTPTLAVSPDTDSLGTVDELRELSTPPKRLSTFDSGNDDPSGVGAVLALRAAIDGQGGHFGKARGQRYLPPPA